MLIITADDFGAERKTTDNILLCYRLNRITSASAMVFASDSIRAAELASGLSIELGLHINLTMPFTGDGIDSKLQERQKEISSYLLSSKFSQIIFNPLLKKTFELVFRAQEEEFVRLYGKSPAFYNGHHHMHLCANIVLGKYLPRDVPVRRTFTFAWGEKGSFNILYRKILDYYINIRHISTDSFHSLSPLENHKVMRKVVILSKSGSVELMVHPDREEEFSFLLSGEYLKLISSTELGTFYRLVKLRKSGMTFHNMCNKQ